MIGNTAKIIFFDVSSKILAAQHCLCQLSKNFKTVGTYSHEVDFTEMIKTIKPDVVVMGVGLFLTKGISSTLALQNDYDDIRVLFRSKLEEIKPFVAEIEHASNVLYIVNTEYMFKVLLDDIKSQFIIPPGTLDDLVEYYNMDLYNGDVVKLTPTEENVLRELVEGESYKIIASKLNVSLETIKTHIKNIYRKLNVHNSAGAVAKAIKYNLLG